MAIAIDFGTSNTVIARWDRATNQSETLKLPGLSTFAGLNPPLIPSLLYVENAIGPQLVVGQMVRDRGLDLTNDPRFFQTFKRGIGTEIPGFMPQIDGRVITFEQVGEWFLAAIIDQLQASDPEVGESLILTVPVDSFEAYRHWLGRVGQSLPVEQIRLLDEPTAAALGYGLGDRQILLVIDFGGGTLDLSLVELNQQVSERSRGFLLKWGQKILADNSAQKAKIARVLAKVGQNLGGTDIDAWLVDYFVRGIGLTHSPLITRLAERLKIQLSLQSQASEVFFDDETLESIELALDRDRFEEILQQHRFFDQLDGAIDQIFQQAKRQGLKNTDIDAVLLVGGTVQIPAVIRWIEQYFSQTKIRCEKPFEAIAHGALHLVQGIEIKDFLYHSYGIRYWDRRQNSHNWHPLIKAGQSYPMSNPVELVLGAATENQPRIELIIGELGAETGGTEIYFDGDRLVTRHLGVGQTSVQPLNDRDGARTIAQLTPPGFPGSDRIKVFFQVDQKRLLRMTVEDLLTNTTLVENQVVVELS